MLVGIYTNKDRDCELKHTRKLIETLEKYEIEYVLHKSLQLVGNYVTFEKGNEFPLDVLIVLGGDGTILSATTIAAKNSIPILGINIGNIGFLSECGADRLENCVKCLKSGDYTTSSRKMVETELNGKRIYALNEIAFYKKNIGKTIRITVKVDGVVLSSFKSDGFLVSTPTGSTAYALSCNGPVINPNVRCLLLVPVNCHHMASKPVVIDEDAMVEITCDEPACVIADGRVQSELVSSVKITKSDLFTKFVCIDNVNFYVRLHEKLSGRIKEG